LTTAMASKEHKQATQEIGNSLAGQWWQRCWQL